MIEQLENMPEGVLGFDFTGEISRSDYEETLIPLLREAVESEDGVRCLCRLGSEFDGYDAGAAWEDLKTGVELGLGRHSAWKRLALVTDIDWIRHLTTLFGWMTPGELKIFSLGDIEAARAWVAAR